MEYNPKKRYPHYGNSRSRIERDKGESVFIAIRSVKLPKPEERIEHTDPEAWSIPNSLKPNRATMKKNYNTQKSNKINNFWISKRKERSCI